MIHDDPRNRGLARDVHHLYTECGWPSKEHFRCFPAQKERWFVQSVLGVQMTSDKMWLEIYGNMKNQINWKFSPCNIWCFSKLGANVHNSNRTPIVDHAQKLAWCSILLTRKLPISNRCKLKPWSIEPNIIKSRSISITNWHDITLFSRLVWHLQGGSPSGVFRSVKPMNDRYIYHKPQKSKI